MTKIKKAILIGAILLGVGATSGTALAASNYNTPAEALAGITGKTVESVLTERAETGKTFGAIAEEAGKLEQYQKEVLEMRKDLLDQKVKAGVLTQEQADRILTSIEQNQVFCEGVGYGCFGQGNRGRGIMSQEDGGMMGQGYGRMMGQGYGTRTGFGYGQAR